MSSLGWGRRFRAAGVHFGLSVFMAAAVAALVFVGWYPGEYRYLAGGQDLFLLLISVDVVIGPLLTFAVFDPVRKTWPHLRRDLVIICLLQIGALAYGLHTVYVVRPVALVFEVDRFRVVGKQDVLLEELPQAPLAFQRLPLFGPWILAAKMPRSAEERLQSIDLALRGFDVGQRPSYWEPYATAQPRVKPKLHLVSELFHAYPEKHTALNAALAHAGLNRENARFLPLLARSIDWCVLLDAEANVKGFLPVDGFLKH